MGDHVEHALRVELNLGDGRAATQPDQLDVSGHVVGGGACQEVDVQARCHRIEARLAEAVYDAPDFASLLQDGLVFAHRAIQEHEVLRKVLETEPERLLPLITVEQNRVLDFITAFLLPYLEREQRAGRIRPRVDLQAAAQYVARLVLSLIASPGRWDMEDPEQVRVLVREELLGGILV